MYSLFVTYAMSELAVAVVHTRVMLKEAYASMHVNVFLLLYAKS